MIYDNYFRDDGERQRINYILLTSINKNKPSNVDRIPEQYIRRDYIVDKLYDRKKMLNK